MSIKITKAERALIDQKLKDLADVREGVDTALNSYNAVVQEEWQRVEGALSDYTRVADELHSLLDDIHARVDAEWDSRSENWQESDTGQEARNWIDGIDSARSDACTQAELEFTAPDELTLESLSVEEGLNDIVGGITDQPE